MINGLTFCRNSHHTAKQQKPKWMLPLGEKRDKRHGTVVGHTEVTNNKTGNKNWAEIDHIKYVTHGQTSGGRLYVMSSPHKAIAEASYKYVKKQRYPGKKGEQSVIRVNSLDNKSNGKYKNPGLTAGKGLIEIAKDNCNGNITLDAKTLPRGEKTRSPLPLYLRAGFIPQNTSIEKVKEKHKKTGKWPRRLEMYLPHNAPILKKQENNNIIQEKVDLE